MATTLTTYNHRYPNPGDTYLDNSNLIVIANTDVSWSRKICEYYCDQRGIPQSNIINVALGTDAVTWTPADNATVISTLFTPVKNKVAGLRRPQGILLGPGVPTRVRWKDFYNNGTTLSTGPSDYGYPSIQSLVGMVPRHDGSSLYTRSDATQTNFSWCNLGAVTSPVLGYAYDYIGQSNTAARYEEYVMPSGGTTSHRRSPETDTVFLGSASQKYIPVGRIGWCSWDSGTYATTETEETVRRAIDNATLASNTYTHETVKKQPFLVSMYNTSGDEHTNWSAYGKLLLDRGYNVKYAYHESQTPSATAEGNLPAAGAAYTNADNITDFEYYFHFGTVTGHYADTNPTSWKPVLGGSSVLMASYGFSQTNYALRNRERACSGVTASSHWASGTSWQGIVHNLLRGFSYLEACYWAGACQIHLPCGDPLYAPFAPERLFKKGGGYFPVTIRKVSK